MEELHELTGYISLVSLILITLSGLLMFNYRRIGGLINFLILKQFHAGFALILILSVMIHFFSTDERHYLLLLGIIGILLILIISLTIRYTQPKKIILIIKIILLCFSLSLLYYGHQIAEEHEHNGIPHHEYHGTEYHKHEHRHDLNHDHDH